jgi:hypothetical protein
MNVLLLLLPLGTCNRLLLLDSTVLLQGCQCCDNVFHGWPLTPLWLAARQRQHGKASRNTRRPLPC